MALRLIEEVEVEVEQGARVGETYSTSLHCTHVRTSQFTQSCCLAAVRTYVILLLPDSEQTALEFTFGLNNTLEKRDHMFCLKRKCIFSS